MARALNARFLGCLFACLFLLIAVMPTAADDATQDEDGWQTQTRAYGLVVLTGSVQRPSEYPIPPGATLNLRQLLTSAGGFADDVPGVTVRVRRAISDKTLKTYDAQYESLDEVDEVELRSNDLVLVSPMDAPETVNADGAEPGATGGQIPQANIPQGQPLMRVFYGALHEDKAVFKSSFSAETQAAIEGQWEQGLKVYHRVATKRLGGKLDTLSFKYEGDEREGKVHVFRDGEVFGNPNGMLVIKEDDGWKLNEK